MKIEVLAARAAKGKLTLRDRLVAYLPRYAPYAARVPRLMSIRDRLPGAAALSERIAGFTSRRKLPAWRSDPFRAPQTFVSTSTGREVVLLPDTFNTYFEPENLSAAVAVLEAGGYRVHVAQATDGRRPLCCGRTFLSAGLVAEARAEAKRLSAALQPFVARDVPVVGLEPSCLFTLRDELGALLPGPDSDRIAAHALLFEEFIARESSAGRLKIPFQRLDRSAYLHGHCHQKAFGAMGAVEATLKLIPGLEVKTIASSCCGMAGAFGYQAETYDVSMKMAELALLPALRKAEADAVIVADGISCRQQIEHGSGRRAIHVAQVLQQSISGP
jgi:Fe-S oxidoreductase